MGRKVLFVGCLVMAFCAGILWNNRGSERITADTYEDHSIPVPYGNPVKDKDISEKLDAIRDVKEHVSDAVSSASDKLSQYEGTADKIADTAGNISDTVGASAGFVQSLLEKATQAVNHIPIP